MNVFEAAQQLSAALWLGGLVYTPLVAHAAMEREPDANERGALLAHAWRTSRPLMTLGLWSSAALALGELGARRPHRRAALKLGLAASLLMVEHKLSRLGKQMHQGVHDHHAPLQHRGKPAPYAPRAVKGTYARIRALSALNAAFTSLWIAASA